MLGTHSLLQRSHCLAARPLPPIATLRPRNFSRRTIAARAFLGQQLPDAATCTFTKGAELTGAAATADPAVWPIIVGEKELAQSDLYTGSFKDVAKSVTINLPPNDDAPPAPVLVFWGGFQARASWYQHIMARIATAGYATVQYDTQACGPFVQTMNFEQELTALPQLLQWLSEQNSDSSNELLHGRLDMSRVAVAGHSRGGKLAALLYAQDHTTVKAAYLLDPVDEFSSSSAVQQLAGQGLAVGVTAAGVTGAFNPEHSDYRHFLAAAACGSQLHIIPDAHHLQFYSAGPYVNALLDTADNLFTDAGMSHMGATLLLALYLYLAGCKASGRPLPASAALGCNNSDERVALFDELYHHMLDDLVKHHNTSLQQLLLPDLPDADCDASLAAEWSNVLQCMREHDEGELLEHAILGQLASIDCLTSGDCHRHACDINSSSSMSSINSFTSLSSLNTLSSADAALTVDGAAAAAAAAAAGAAGVGADAGRERVAGLTAEAMLLWLDAALKK